MLMAHALWLGLSLLVLWSALFHALDYAIVDTNQYYAYNDSTKMALWPASGQDFYGSDRYYLNNGDGTTTDAVIGLMWTQDPGSRVTGSNAIANASSITTGGYIDWRVLVLVRSRIIFFR